MEQDVRADQAAAEGRGREAWGHLKAAGEEIRRGVASMVPPECRAHSRAAGREALLAARSVLDAAIEQLDKRSGAQ